MSVLGRLVMDKLDRGVILLDGQGRVVDANALAAHLIEAGDGLRLRSGRLVFADAALDARLSKAIARQRAGSADGPAAIAARVRRDGGAPYRVVVAPIPPDADARDVAFFVLIYPPNTQQDISPAVLREMYGLTPAQADVVRSLFAGRSVEETAQVLELSLNTVRTHLKQIFNKCEVSSQAELMHLLALGPLDL